MDLHPLLRTGFDGHPAADFDDIRYGVYEDPRHRDRVPSLTALMNDEAASAMDRFLACVVLTTWAEPAGYEAVLRAAADPRNAPWYDISVDRKFSVDSTFAQLADALGSGEEPAEEKGHARLRTEALRALVRIADTEYFEEKLEGALHGAALAALLPDVVETVLRGVRALESGRRIRFDLATQLVDLACAISLVDAPVAVALAERVIAADPGHRVLVHATTVVARAEGEERRRLARRLLVVGDEEIRRLVAEAVRAADHSAVRQGETGTV
ncbi:hypothetical protein [Streptomyces triculaminicus]|uniref:hypothetical protein n=1 Tax=Streptomyces triculaminicus TaxID=2816232 RepID=UPI0037D83B17